MTTLKSAKMPSLKDKIEASEAPKKLIIEEELEEIKSSREEKPAKKAAIKGRRK